MLSYRNLQIHLQNLEIELSSTQDLIKQLQELESNPSQILYLSHGKKMTKVEIQNELSTIKEFEQALMAEIMELTLLVGVEEADE